MGEHRRRKDIARMNGTPVPILGKRPNHGTKPIRGVVYHSETGDEPWEPMHLDDVPAWVKDPHVMGDLVTQPTQAVSNEEHPGDGWYRFEADKVLVH